MTNRTMPVIIKARYTINQHLFSAVLQISFGRMIEILINFSKCILKILTEQRLFSIVLCRRVEYDSVLKVDL